MLFRSSSALVLSPKDVKMGINWHLGVPNNSVAAATLGATTSVLMGKTQQSWCTAFK